MIRATWLVAATCAAWSPAQAGALTPPIAEAAQGQLQCYAPNEERKACRSLAAYRLTAAGAIENTAIVLISENPAITMRTVSQVEVKGEQVCGPIRAQDIDTATFAAGDRPASQRQTNLLRAKMRSAMKGLIGHEVCTAYTPDADGLLATASVDGVRQPSMDQQVVWVQPGDGYVVAP